MPVQRTTSGSLLAGLGKKLVDAHQEHKDDAPVYGNQELPDVDNGVARLVLCQLGKFKDGANVGKPFFMAQGVVVAPAEAGGMPILGMRTRIGPEPLCDTPNAQGKRKTLGDHWAYMTSELKKLEFEVGEIRVTSTDPNAAAKQIEDGIVAGMAALVRNQPYFRFRVWRGNKQELKQEGGRWFVLETTKTGQVRAKRGPYATEQAAKTANPFAGRDSRPNHEWNGTCEFSDNGDVGAGVVDQSEEEPPAAGEPEAPPPGGEAGVDDLEDLVARAEAEPGDGDAQQRLVDLAIELGYDKGEVESEDKTWADLAEMIRSGPPAVAEGESAAEPEPEPEGPREWAKEEICKVKVKVLGRNRKMVLKAVQAEVVAVYKRSRTCDVRRLDTKAVVKGVRWDDMEEVE